jgi:hypothetical protein
MNRLLGFLTFIIIIGCNHKESKLNSPEAAPPNHLAQNNLKGNISEYSEIQYFDVNSPPDKYNSKTTTKLNAAGNVIETIDMGVTHTIKYENDSEIHTIRNTQTNLLLSVLKVKKSYRNGVAATRHYYDNGKFYKLNEIKYGKDGRIMWEREQNFNINDRTRNKRTYNYLNRSTIEILSYDLNGDSARPTLKTIRTLDKLGNIISVKDTLLNRNDSRPITIPEQVYKYEYDKKGNWITQYWHTGKNSIPFMKNTRVYIYK